MTDDDDVQDPAARPQPSPPVRGLRRSGRRVTTDPAPGSDPNPAPSDRRRDGSDNDQRLKADKPPHWG